MNQLCVDVFQEYELPFKTFFSKGVLHKDQVHDEVELIWVLRGSVVITCDGSDYSLGSQTLFMINIGQVHTIQSSADSVIITYRFKKEHLAKNNVTFDEFRFENKVHTFDELVAKYREVPQLVTQLLSILITPNQSNVVRYKIIGFYNMLVYELYTMLLKERYLDIKKRNFDNYMDRLSKVTSYVQEHFKRKVSLDEVADLVNLSKYRLSHFVKEYLGIPLQEYIKRIRMDFALKLLRESSESVVEVASLSGFSDVKYLNEALKERLGMTALKYRKLMLSEVSVMRTNVEDFKTELRTCLKMIESKMHIGGTL